MYRRGERKEKGRDTKSGAKTSAAEASTHTHTHTQTHRTRQTCTETGSVSAAGAQQEWNTQITFGPNCNRRASLQLDAQWRDTMRPLLAALPLPASSTSVAPRRDNDNSPPLQHHSISSYS